MKRILIFFLLFVSILANAQIVQKPSQSEINKAPKWAQKMYEEKPNVREVENLFNQWKMKNPTVKNFHTQYYKRWRKNIGSNIDKDGFAVEKSIQQQLNENEAFKQKAKKKRSNGWSLVGPIQTYNNDEANSFAREQANIYCVDQCISNKAIMYCGSETGMVFKSTDTGNSWTDVGFFENFNGGISAIEVDPFNPNNVFVGSGKTLYKSNNGGSTWALSLAVNDLGVNEILVMPNNTNIVYVATQKGLYKSTDGGNSFIQIYTENCWDIKTNPSNPNTVYLAKNNPTLIRAEIFKSSNGGNDWTLMNNGWYNSTDPNRTDEGCRIAVTNADTNRVYAFLMGYAKANDNGYIGVYRSDNGGATWTLPNGPDGGPYTTTHPNLSIGNPDWQYYQGFYNCALMASNTDPNKILVGSLNVWKSDNGGATFECINGYAAGTTNLGMHVDNQDFRAIDTTYWITTDGGIYESSDFYATTPSIKDNGIYASEYWGLGQGWNEDVLVGGLYHNGVLGYVGSYGVGNFLALGGAEPASGYVNPGETRRVYSTEIGARTLPSTIGEPMLGGSFGKSPNESYTAAESSEMEFLPESFNTCFIGNENKLWKSTDGASSFVLFHAFGNITANGVQSIEISRSNSNVMYVSQQVNNNGTGKLWKTTNGGTSWSQLTIPAGNNRLILLSLDASDENLIYMAYPEETTSGNNVFKSTNGGASWTTISTAMLNNEHINTLALIPNTDGGVYVGTWNTFYYKNNSMPDWQIVNSGLPLFFPANKCYPFYKDGKLRAASYGKGIWETALEQQPTTPIAQATVNKLNSLSYCVTDTLQFEDYSIINHNGATWNWTFQDGTPATSNIRNPKVFFANEGTHQVVLTIKDAANNIDKDTIYVTNSSYAFPQVVNEGFQNEFVPNGFTINDFSSVGTWSLNTTVGGFGNSTQSTYFNNYSIDCGGNPSDFRFYANLSSSTSSYLKFDVAYAEYSPNYSDTLEVLISKDCGVTFTSVYKKGGDDLATSPDNSEEFFPTATEWRTDSINVANYLGNPKCIVAFRNIGRYGNNIFVDNINLNASGPSSIPTIHNENVLGIYPNPISEKIDIQIYDPNNIANYITVYNMEGKIVMRQDVKNNLHVKNNLAKGTYIVQIVSDKYIKNCKLIVQ